MTKIGFSKSRRYSSRLVRKILWIGLFLLAISTVVAFLELTDRTYIFHKQKAVPGIIPSTPTSDSSPSSENKANTVPSSETNVQTEDPKQDSSSPTNSTGSAPLDPYGNFVSNHHPNLDGSPAPSSVQSVCNTSPGASCYIEFTNQDGVVKQLTAQTTDGNGATYWAWDVKQAGFTAGSWKIKVVATMDGQTKTTDDVQNLEVGP